MLTIIENKMHQIISINGQELLELPRPFAKEHFLEGWGRTPLCHSWLAVLLWWHGSGTFGQGAQTAGVHHWPPRVATLQAAGLRFFRCQERLVEYTWFVVHSGHQCKPDSCGAQHMPSPHPPLCWGRNLWLFPGSSTEQPKCQKRFQLHV